jgi:hypothetical protein
MDEMIKKQAAINAVKRFAGYLDDDMIYRIVLALERLPDAVVRCKDCKCFETKFLTDGAGYFYSPCSRMIDRTENDFCSRPERKEQEGEMLNIPKPEHVPETPPRLKVGQYIIYRNNERYELGRVKEITKDGAFVSYTEGNGGSLTLFSDMHPLVNDYCIEKTTLGGDFFGNSEE